jgi:hypothetical protein
MSSLIDKGRILAAAAAIVVGGCTVSASPASPSPTASGASPAPSVAAPPSVSASPIVAASPSPAATPKPTQPPAAWSKPRPVGTAANCTSVTAGIDSGSRYHVASECGGSIVYSASNRDGSWSSKVFAHPVNRMDLDPQIAFNGQVAYVAFTRIAPDGGCGTLGVDVGVYYRQTRPDGSWTDEKRIGAVADGLDSFRVAGGIIHAIVLGAGAEPVMYYEIVDGTSTHRYPISHGFGKMSLRVGQDGRARIAYAAPPGALRYAVFNGSGLSTSVIGGTREDDQLPALVLDQSNHAHLLWSRMPSLLGCANGEPTPEDGTYYATNASGKWVSGRITTNLGATSLQIDEVTGRIHVLVAGSGVRYYTKLPGGSWGGTKVTSATVPLKSAAAAIRLDPATGRLLIVYLAQQSNALGKVYAITKP